MGPVVPITADLSLGLMVGAHVALSASEGVPAGLPAHLQSWEEHRGQAGAPDPPSRTAPVSFAAPGLSPFFDASSSVGFCNPIFSVSIWDPMRCSSHFLTISEALLCAVGPPESIDLAMWG